MAKHKYHPSKTPVIRRVRMEHGKIGAVFQEMMEFIAGRTVKRMEIVAEAVDLSKYARMVAKKMHRPAVPREHRLVIELVPRPVAVDKRRRGA